ncbi:MAG: MmgE/PrpD family protein [Chloroflexi bacterium]|nr:MmgE/PrpD family protein [Chloroflexota bacterium]
MDIMYDLVRWVLRTRYEDLPQELIEIVKKTVIDTLAVTIAGTNAAGSRILVDLARDWGGKEESSILIHGGKVPAPTAALVNATAARAWDLDDDHEGGMGHVSASTVPAALALAEYVRRPVSGKEFILVNALCTELHGRLRLVTQKIGWLAETVAPFGVVAMGGKLLGFDEERMMNGMGIAYAQCSGSHQDVLDGTLSLRLKQGLGVRAGIFATVLAERGFTGARNVLQGVYGLFPMFFRNVYDAAALTRGLGQKYEMIDISIKSMPGCFGVHRPVYGALALMKENNIKAEEIDEITITCNTWLQRNTFYSEEGDTKYRPRNIVDAQFSTPWTVAKAVLKGAPLWIDDFTEESIREPGVLAMTQRVKGVADPEKDRMMKEKTGFLPSTEVAIRTKSGQRYLKSLEYVHGHPRDPFTMADCVEKLRRCLPFSARPLGEDRLRELLRVVEHLEETNDVTAIIRLLNS